MNIIINEVQLNPEDSDGKEEEGSSLINYQKVGLVFTLETISLKSVLNHIYFGSEDLYQMRLDLNISTNDNNLQSIVE